MSFDEISSRGGLAATNSTSEYVNNFLFGSPKGCCMSQNDILYLEPSLHERYYPGT